MDLEGRRRNASLPLRNTIRILRIQCLRAAPLRYRYLDRMRRALHGHECPSPLSLTVVPPLSVTTTSLPASPQFSAYSAILAATSKPLPTVGQSGALPAGLALASSTGVISGTPTVAGTSKGITVVTQLARERTNSRPHQERVTFYNCRSRRVLSKEFI